MPSYIVIGLEGGPLDGQTRKVLAETIAIAEMPDNFMLTGEDWQVPSVYTRSGITRYGVPVFTYSEKMSEQSPTYLKNSPCENSPPSANSLNASEAEST